MVRGSIDECEHWPHVTIGECRKDDECDERCVRRDGACLRDGLDEKDEREQCRI
jgi:hypothetical protein